MDTHSLSTPTSAYTSSWLSGQKEGSRKSAKVVLSELFQSYRPGSIIDIGCGSGAWLAEAQSLGVEEVVGVDGAYTDTEQLLIPRDRFLTIDLEKELPEGLRFDLAISLEVAEHLPPARATSFVEGLCKLSDVVLFSAAIPLQGGNRHLNEQWQSYWASIFEANGFCHYLYLRSRLWNHEQVLHWYRQNLILYVKTDSPTNTVFQSVEQDICPLDVIHPEPWLYAREKIKRSIPIENLLDGRSLLKLLGKKILAKTRFSTSTSAENDG